MWGTLGMEALALLTQLIQPWLTGGMWQCWEQAGLCSELERFKHGNVKALSCCHPPTAPTATPEVPHSCIQETEPRRNMQSPGWAGRCSMHRWARAAFPALAEPHRHMHLVTAQSHPLPSANPSKPGSPVCPVLLNSYMELGAALQGPGFCPLH